MKYTKVLMAHTTPKGEFIQAVVGKRIMKHVLKAVKKGAQVTMTEWVEGSHVPITVYGEWIRKLETLDQTSIPGDSELERTVTQSWREYRHSRQSASNMKIFADIEIIG